MSDMMKVQEDQRMSQNMYGSGFDQKQQSNQPAYQGNSMLQMQ